MLRQLVKASRPVCDVPLRRYTTSLSHTLQRPRCCSAYSLNSSATTRAALFSTTCTSRRWCSAGEKSDSTTAAAAAAAPPPSSPPAPTNAAETSSATVPSVAEQLSGLSVEDQQRILAALTEPEKEKSSTMGGAGIGPKDGEMVAAFTCGPCDYRMVKRFSKHAYTKGIVIVECPNCRAKHLLADNLGWLEDEARNIEDILREKGESFTRIGGTTGDFQVVVGPDGAAGDADSPAAAAASAATTKS